jgi:L-asparaginase/N4-(beta-N-acetylglucosaminyl)-L-asparaginase
MSILLSTWRFGKPANDAAWPILAEGGYAMDAVEAGIRVAEADPTVTNVGYGALPDADGVITLDACVMDENSRCGAVAALENIRQPISVARRVMEQTPYILLAGQGAREFAVAQGFQRDNLLTPKARARWEEWKASGGSGPMMIHPEVNAENHDTIAMLALDSAGRLCGGCSTSGLAWKRHGRVGDSPIIGAGLYVDGKVGAACATGRGEAALRTSVSFLIVELMRHGLSPQDACLSAIDRVVEIETRAGYGGDFQVGVLAVSVAGEIGAFAVRPGFECALCIDGDSQIHDVPSWTEPEGKAAPTG